MVVRTVRFRPVAPNVEAAEPHRKKTSIMNDKKIFWNSELNKRDVQDGRPCHKAISPSGNVVNLPKTTHFSVRDGVANPYFAEIWAEKQSKGWRSYDDFKSDEERNAHIIACRTKQNGVDDRFLATQPKPEPEVRYVQVLPPEQVQAVPAKKGKSKE